MAEVAILIIGVLVVLLVISLSTRRYNCPACKGRVAKDARVCRHCGYRVPEEPI